MLEIIGSYFRGIGEIFEIKGGEGILYEGEIGGEIKGNGVDLRRNQTKTYATHYFFFLKKQIMTKINFLLDFFFF